MTEVKHGHSRLRTHLDFTLKRKGLWQRGYEVLKSGRRPSQHEMLRKAPACAFFNSIFFYKCSQAQLIDTVTPSRIATAGMAHARMQASSNHQHTSWIAVLSIPTWLSPSAADGGCSAMPPRPAPASQATRRCSAQSESGTAQQGPGATRGSSLAVQVIDTINSARQSYDQLESAMSAMSADMHHPALVASMEGLGLKKGCRAPTVQPLPVCHCVMDEWTFRFLAVSAAPWLSHDMCPQLDHANTLIGRCKVPAMLVVHCDPLPRVLPVWADRRLQSISCASTSVNHQALLDCTFASCLDGPF